MPYHITVNGVPYCQAPVYSMLKAAGASAEAQCACGYGHKLPEAETDAAKLARALPDAVVKVAEGLCGNNPWWSMPNGRHAAEMEVAMDDYRTDAHAGDKPTRRLARYTVIVERELGDEDGQNYLDVIDESSAIQQLRDEIQEAFDEGRLAGNFNIEKREEIEIK
jgi:hypothetical protein